ncbi:hypothetical protein N5D79_28275 [Pseudomonas sp. GD03817]|uniref:hypothetical protein n=1 Tax=Pseudomonas TaxID=286 RepID=UPI000360E1E8|nr:MULTISPECIES: hypothetical protein [Pseudomonas]MCE0993340.1 hypothetical protein [Pseudomonas alloputida]MDD2012654.1 hypothetical protein [Pseudomonas putida]MDH1405716.1 hypothetical protein [Pseudomonas sp. GD03730]MDH1778756.1 hypothetical protein [Pseudomonas sp. GD03817]QKL08904.1 hypothetical protein GEV41_21785 [Pseudomonas putida]
MYNALLLIAAIALTGCAASSEMKTVRGKTGVHINCSGLSSSWDRCYQRAEVSCSTRGYRVVARSGDTEEEAGDYLFGINPAGFTSRSMIVICK